MTVTTNTPPIDAAIAAIAPLDRPELPLVCWLDGDDSEEDDEDEVGDLNSDDVGDDFVVGFTNEVDTEFSVVVAPPPPKILQFRNKLERELRCSLSRCSNRYPGTSS